MIRGPEREPGRALDPDLGRDPVTLGPEAEAVFEPGRHIPGHDRAHYRDQDALPVVVVPAVKSIDRIHAVHPRGGRHFHLLRVVVLVIVAPTRSQSVGKCIIIYRHHRLHYVFLNFCHLCMLQVSFHIPLSLSAIGQTKKKRISSPLSVSTPHTTAAGSSVSPTSKVFILVKLNSFINYIIFTELPFCSLSAICQIHTYVYKSVFYHSKIYFFFYK